MRITVSGKLNPFSVSLMSILCMVFLAMGLWLHTISLSRQEPEADTLPTFSDVASENSMPASPSKQLLAVEAARGLSVKTFLAFQNFATYERAHPLNFNVLHANLLDFVKNELPPERTVKPSVRAFPRVETLPEQVGISLPAPSLFQPSALKVRKLSAPHTEALSEKTGISFSSQHLLKASVLSLPSLPDVHPVKMTHVEAADFMANLSQSIVVPRPAFLSHSSPAVSPPPVSSEKFYYVNSDQEYVNPNLYRELRNIFEDAVPLSPKRGGSDHFSLLRDHAGHILLATVTHDHQTYQAVRYQGSDGEAKYYTPFGKALWKSAFLSKPVSYTRISDRFTMRRWHPILHIIRPHYGIDYAAPSGTPVRAVADGQVTFAGWGGGYGNSVIIHHGQRYQTLYAHLNRRGFSKMKSGQRIKRGQIIGYVGSTGLATGPHLHFGMYEYGKAVNPERVLPKRNPPLSIAEQDLPDFLAKTNQLMMQFAAMQNDKHILHG